MRALAVDIRQEWIERHRYLNMELLLEHKNLKHVRRHKHLESSWL